MDYAYTINGWMKTMNGTILNPGYELGRDNASGYLSQNTSVHNKFAKDVVAYTLGYFNGDYKSIGSTNFAPSPYGVSTLNSAISQLYNGNIAYTTTAIADVPSGPAMAIQMGVYRYDQLNRLVSARTFRASGLAASNSWAGAAETQEYKSTYSYDKNGNLTHLLRNGGATNVNMDDFIYQPETVGGNPSNRLDYVDDNTGYTGNYTQDIDDQSSDNYGYDKLGQLVRDNSEGSMTIEWFSGNRKVKKITRTDKTIEFEYNPFGQRILKKVNDLSLSTITTSYYAYDANGQVMGVYDVNLTSNNASLNELNIYGASRVGVIDRDITLCTAGTAATPPVYPDTIPIIHTLGYKKYEITNYLGNVNAVINDRKIYVSGTYEAVVIMNSDYYPFGMEMPGRHTNISNYRFGYNGMEMDNEAKGNGNSYTTEFRQYDPRLGRWMSLDPLMGKYPSMSPYLAFNDNPIFFTDPMGLASKGGPEGEDPNPDAGSEHSDRGHVDGGGGPIESKTHVIEDYDKFGFTGKIITNSPRMTTTAADGISTVQIAKGSNVLFVNTKLESSVISPGGYTHLAYSIDYNSSTYTWNDKDKWYTNDKGESYPDPHWLMNAGMGITASGLNMTIGDGFQKMKNNAAKVNMSLGDYMVSQIASGVAETVSDIWAGGHRGDIAWAQLWMTTPMTAYEGLLVKPFDFFTFSANGGYGTKISLFRTEFEFMYRNPSVKGGTLFSLKTANNSKFRIDYHSLPSLGIEGKKLHYHTNFGGRALKPHRSFGFQDFGQPIKKKI